MLWQRKLRHKKRKLHHYHLPWVGSLQPQHHVTVPDAGHEEDESLHCKLWARSSKVRHEAQKGSDCCLCDCCGPQLCVEPSHLSWLCSLRTLAGPNIQEARGRNLISEKAAEKSQSREESGDCQAGGCQEPRPHAGGWHQEKQKALSINRKNSDI